MSDGITRRSVVGTALAGIAAAPYARTAAAKALASPSPETQLAGKITLKGESQYEPLRLAATWNARKPNRFPSAIVLPETERDIVAAVKLAKERGWQVTTRSGGHSFTGSHTRDNALQINLAGMKELSINPKARVAKLTPSWMGGAFNNVLRDEHQLMFPIAHGFDIGIGGFVMCGGHGWNYRALGRGCENLRALDLVTADGELIHASETENSDFLWAARGSGPGFFGVAVRYYLDVHPQPTHVRFSQYVFPLSLATEVGMWFESTPFPDFMEPVIVYMVKDNKPVLQVMTVTFAHTDEQVTTARTIMKSCPIAGKALEQVIDVPAPIPSRSEAEDVYQGPMGGRYTVDGAYTDTPIAEVLALLHDELVSPPIPGCSITIMNMPPLRRPDQMAYSMTGRNYLSAMAISYDPAQDAVCAEWLAKLIAKLAPIAPGAQMNDENMPVNRLPYLSKEAAAKLEMLRDRHDPQRRFTSFLSSTDTKPIG